MTENRYSLTGWAEKESEEFDLSLPSGQLCLVRKLKMEDIIKAGLIDDLDYFSTKLVTSGSKKSKNASEQEQTPGDLDGDDGLIRALGDPAKFKKITDVMDKVVALVVLQPQISTKPLHKLGKDAAGKVFIGDIGFDDKIAIFSRTFTGLGDMSRFHEGEDEGVGAVPASESVSLPAE